jgi:hypothetical protein
MTPSSPKEVRRCSESSHGDERKNWLLLPNEKIHPPGRGNEGIARGEHLAFKNANAQIGLLKRVVGTTQRGVKE